MDKIVFENIFRSNVVSFNESGFAVCPHCNGTGLNADFNLFNKINEQMHPDVSVCCLKCYGKGWTDWIEIANGRIDEITEYLFHHNRQFLAQDIFYPLDYVYAGYVVPSNSGIHLWYDEEADEWKETTGIRWPGHIESKNEMFYWIDKLNENSYIRNPEPISSVLHDIYDPSLDYEWAAKIKDEIINSSVVEIYDLLEWKRELKILGYSIEDLNEIVSDKEPTKNFNVDFVFTWENLIDKFNLPRIHKYSPVPDGVLTI